MPFHGSVSEGVEKARVVSSHPELLTHQNPRSSSRKFLDLKRNSFGTPIASYSHRKTMPFPQIDATPKVRSDAARGKRPQPPEVKYEN
jgi:hypothetical protein